MYKNEREQEIINLLNNYSYATVDFLAKKLCISASSIRRDLSAMEQRGIVKRS